MPVLRHVVGETLRGLRLRRGQTLRQVSQSARVSLGYLSELERGQKEASSELLGSICSALDVELSELFAEVSAILRREEVRAKVAALATDGSVPGNARASLSVAPAGEGAAQSSAQVRLKSVAAA